MARTALSLRVILPSLWFGMIAAISFIEAPLKFQAPGITLELGLGIGRLVFTALNISSVVILVLLTVATVRPRPSRVQAWLLGALWFVVLAEVAVIRPLLNVRTDAVLAGESAPFSGLHYVYIAADLVIMALLAAFTVASARVLVRAPERG